MKRYFKRLSIELLHSALSYQRGLNESFIEKKVKEFDSNEVNAPKISLRIKNGKEEYRIIDGQHTISIVTKVGWKNINCEIREGLTDEEEHKWFFNINDPDGSRSQSSSVLLNSRINGKFDDTINTLVNSLDSIGYKIKTVDVKYSDSVIRAGKTMELIFKDMNEFDFKQCMQLHKNVFNGDKKSLTSPFLKGIKKFYDIYKEEIDEKRFVQSLLNKNITASDIIKDVNSSMLKTNNDVKYAWVFVEYYNKGLKDENKRLKFSKLGV